MRSRILLLSLCLSAGPAAAIVDEDVEILRGDANSSSQVTGADASFILEYLYQSGSPPQCADAADANDDGAIDNSDATYILEYVYNGGPPPPAPGPTICGIDPTSDSLDCAQGCN